MSFDSDFQARYLKKFADEMRGEITFSDYSNWMENIREFLDKIPDAFVRDQALAMQSRISRDVRIYDSFDELPDDHRKSIANEIV